jgi:hypothetical protein
LAYLACILWKTQLWGLRDLSNGCQKCGFTSEERTDLIQSLWNSHNKVNNIVGRWNHREHKLLEIWINSRSSEALRFNKWWFQLWKSSWKRFKVHAIFSSWKLLKFSLQTRFKVFFHNEMPLLPIKHHFSYLSLH